MPTSSSAERITLPVTPPDALLTQREAAAWLRVGTWYLRASDCPKILLPPARGRRPRVRYRRADLLAWAEQLTARATVPQRRTPR